MLCRKARARFHSVTSPRRSAATAPAAAAGQLRLAERLEAPLDLLHLLGDGVEAPHVGRVEGREQDVDGGRVGHPPDYTGPSLRHRSDPPMPTQSHYRVVILGSGPAGLTAAVYASRAELQPLVVEGGGGDDPTDVPGGQLMLTTEVDNYPGFPEGVLGPELMDRMRKQAERFGTEFATGELKSAALKERPFRADASSSGEITADTVIVATGARAKWLNLPEELEFRTKIGGVSACATCDGFFYKGKEVLVVGGGDTAMEEATFLTQVRLEGHDRPPPRGAAREQGHADAGEGQPEDRVAPRQRDREGPRAARARASPARW